MDHHIVTDIDTHMACTGCVIRSLEEDQISDTFSSGRHAAFRSMHVQTEYHSGQAIHFSRYMKVFYANPSYNETLRACFTVV